MPQNKRKRDGYSRTPGLTEFPGFRTRSNRSGLDPVDTYRERAFMEGLFIRKAFTLQLRTKNPFYLALMLIFGIAMPAITLPFLWMVLPISWEWDADLLPLLFLDAVLCFVALLGFALFVNFFVNVVHWRKRSN